MCTFLPCSSRKSLRLRGESRPHHSAHHTVHNETVSGPRLAKPFLIGSFSHGCSTHVKYFLCVCKRQCRARKPPLQARTGARRDHNGYCCVGAEVRNHSLKPTLRRPTGENPLPPLDPPRRTDPLGVVCAHFRGGACTILYLRPISAPTAKGDKGDRTKIGMRDSVFVQTVALILHLPQYPQPTPLKQRARTTVWAEP